jgi:hypothetical protein
MLSENFIKTAQQLHDTEQRDVVKVASLVRKLQNLWKTLTSAEHRANVEMLEAETAKTLLNANKLTEDLGNLSAAISDGDLQQYLTALSVVKERVKLLEQEVDAIRVGANTEFNETARQLPEDFDLNLDDEYDAPLKDFSWLRDRPQTLHFASDKAAQILLGKTVHALRKSLPDVDIREVYFSDDNIKAFLGDVVNAVFNGKIQGRIQDTPKGRVFSVKTAPISLPGDPKTKVVIHGRLKDDATSLQGQLAWRGTDKVEVVSLAELAQQVEQEPAPESEPPARGVPEDEIPVIEEMPETEPSAELAEPVADEPQLALPFEQKQDTATASRVDELHKLAYKTVPNRLEELSKLALQPQQLPYKLNNLSDVEFAEALREGYKTAFGKDPTAETLAGAWAQATLESGRPVG